MQAKDIVLGTEYVTKSGTAFRVDFLLTRRSVGGTTNYARGPVIFNNRSDKAGQQVDVEVRDVVSTLAADIVAKARQKAALEAREAKEKARDELQHAAVKALSEAIGVPMVLDRYGHGRNGVDVDWRNEPAVVVDGRGLEVNEYALPMLLAFLKK